MIGRGVFHPCSLIFAAAMPLCASALVAGPVVSNLSGDQAGVFAPMNLQSQVSAPRSDSVLLLADFDDDPAGFEFVGPALQGAHLPDEGFSGGALRMTLADQDDPTHPTSFTGWQRDISLSQPTEARLSFLYSLKLPREDTGEVVVLVDGVSQTVATAQQSAGWHFSTVHLRGLSAGDHTLTIGATRSGDGASELMIDDVVMESLDVMVQAETVRFAVIGDFGDDSSAEADVADLVASGNVDLIVTVGDNNYPDGELSTIDANVGKHYHDFIFPYLGSYGSGSPDGLNRFFPALGNHDWGTPNAQPHLDYFTLPGNERYYDFVWGPVHFFILDSDFREPDGNTATSVQAQWLQNEMSNSEAPFQFVFSHHPPYSSGRHGSNSFMQWPFAQWGADAYFGGHDHTYERIHRDGIVHFINGLGGRSIYEFPTVVSGSQVRYNDDYGAMLVVADGSTATCQFYSRAGELIDTHTIDANTPSNTPPVAVDDFATISNTTVSGNIMANDSDPDGDPLTLIGFTQPDNGTVTDIGSGNGTVSYDPDSGFYGEDVFTYTISDGRGGADRGTVTLTVEDSGNTPPVAVDDSATIPNTTVSGNIMANDSDPDGDTLTLISFTQPANGTVTDTGNGNGTLTYDPDSGFSGQDTFDYTISDGRGGTDTATVTLNVQ